MWICRRYAAVPDLIAIRKTKDFRNICQAALVFQVEEPIGQSPKEGTHHGGKQ